MAFLGGSFLQFPVSLEDIRLKAMINSSVKLMLLTLLTVYILECLGLFLVEFFSFTQKSTFLNIKLFELDFMAQLFSVEYQP